MEVASEHDPRCKICSRSASLSFSIDHTLTTAYIGCALVGEQTCVLRMEAGLLPITILTNANVRVVWRRTERGGDRVAGTTLKG